MSTKITVIYDNPESADVFEAGYPDQVTLARKLPGVERVESARVWPKEDGSPTPAYRLFDMYFADYDTARRRSPPRRLRRSLPRSRNWPPAA